jgi:hypothetical protein
LVIKEAVSLCTGPYSKKEIYWKRATLFSCRLIWGLATLFNQLPWALPIGQAVLDSQREERLGEQQGRWKAGVTRNVVYLG